MSTNDLTMLKEKLLEIKGLGWVKNQRPGNVGGVGNTLEDLLEVAENNFQLPDFGEWEIKSQRAETVSLLTLFHKEPKPRNAKIVPQILLLKYGWPHEEAGTRYPENEKSFRQTINTQGYSARGFKVKIDYTKKIIFIDFNYASISDRLAEWREDVRRKAGISNIDPKPFWTFDDIAESLRAKLNNLMYVQADSKKEGNVEYFHYNQIEAYINPSIDKFLGLMEQGLIYVDFDARTGHNHGTKFRIKPFAKKDLYQEYIKV